MILIVIAKNHLTGETKEFETLEWYHVERTGEWIFESVEYRETEEQKTKAGAKSRGGGCGGC
jgi:hypothetical protein